MADNFISYNRFTAMPPNISTFGATVEEVKLQRGQPDKNPTHSPMAAPRVSLRRLALKPRGSDQARLAEPDQPPVDPYEGARPAVSLLREAAGKLSGDLLGSLAAHLEESAAVPAQLREPMRQSCRRLSLLGQHLGQINAMVNAIQGRALATRQG